jgi:periplasmic divalent cation tolerance protein
VADVVTVEMNCPDADVARAIAEALVGRRLAAAANIHAPIESLYRWQGRIERRRETPLVLKTRAELATSLVEAARALHPYATPAILTRAAHATADCAGWIAAETAGGV